MRTFLISSVLCMLVGAASADVPTYQVTDLGDLGGGMSMASGVNDLGQVVGLSINAVGAPCPFVWDSTNGMVDIGALPGGDGWGLATAINNSGYITGIGSYGSATHGFVYHASTGMVDIGDLPGGPDSSKATCINNAGVVFGQSGVAGGVEDPDELAVKWTASAGLVSIGDLPGGRDYSMAYGCNDLGQAVGYSNGEGVYRDHAFIWSESTGMVDISSAFPSDTFGSYAYDVNNNGQVVGYRNRLDGAPAHAFLWSEAGGAVDLGALYDDIAIANAINDDGLVVGSTGIDGHGFVWTAEAGMVAADSLLDPADSAWTIMDLAAVNDLGQIVGYGVSPTGDMHAVLLTPVPEPSSALLLLCGGTWLAVRRRR